MAEPIKQFKPEPRNKEELKQENLDHVLDKLAENREAVDQLLTIAGELHESGMLDIIKSLLKTRVEVSEVAMKQVNQPKTLNILRNVMGAAEALGSIDPDQLNKMLDGVAAGVKQSAVHDQPEEPIGILGMYKATKNSNIQTSLHMMMQFLEGMGQHLNEKENN